MHRLLLAGLLTSCFAAWASPPSLQHFGRHVITLGFDRRQTNQGIPTVPSQCQSDCPATILNILNTNQCSVTTCCSSNFQMGFFNCAKCVGDASGTTNFTSIQVVLDDLHNECATAGISLPKLTFPGQDPNRQLSSVASTRPAATSSPVSAPASNAPAAPTGQTISQITITSIPPVSAAPTIGQSTVTAPPTNTAASSAGTRVIWTPSFHSWAIASIAGIPLLGMLYLGV